MGRGALYPEWRPSYGPPLRPLRTHVHPHPDRGGVDATSREEGRPCCRGQRPRRADGDLTAKGGRGVADATGGASYADKGQRAGARLRSCDIKMRILPCAWTVSFRWPSFCTRQQHSKASADGARLSFLG